MGGAFELPVEVSWAAPDASIRAPNIRYLNGRYYIYYVVTRATVTGELNDNAVGVAIASTPAMPCKDAGVRGLPGWRGGYDLGLPVPPDWVGGFLFGVQREGSDLYFQRGMVANYESDLYYVTIDTIVCEEDGARPLSSGSRKLLVADT